MRPIYGISSTTLDYWFPAFYDAAYSHLTSEEVDPLKKRL